jgi:hypothetical protein
MAAVATAPVPIVNTEPPLVAPPDFMLTEFVHDKFYGVGELIKNNAHLIVRDLIKDCDLTQGYSDDTQNAANATPNMPAAGHDIFKQFKNSAFCFNQPYTDSILFRKMFGMDYPNIRQRIKTGSAPAGRGGKGEVYVCVIDSSAPPPALAAAGVTKSRIINKKKVSLYSYVDMDKHNRGTGGHKKYTSGTLGSYQGSDFQYIFENVPVKNVNATTAAAGRAGLPYKNLFFISDCCSDLVRILSDTPHPLGLAASAGTPPPGPFLNINIVISTHTLGDPSPRTDQRAKNFLWPMLSTNGTKRIIRYEDTGTMNTIQACNPLLLINSQVVMSLSTPQKNIVNQAWQSANPTAATMNGSVNNANVNNTLKKLKSQYNPNNVLAPTYLAQAQKKRYGDHGQIAFAKRFPNEAKKPPPPQLFVTVYDSLTHNINDTATILDSETNHLFVAGLTEEEIRKGTFFLTGDWPAFCYAVYNQINSIIHIKCKNGKSEIFAAVF